MKILFYTFVTDAWYLSCGCQKLERSARYFHPEIPFITAKSNEFTKDKGDYWLNLKPIVVEKIARVAELAKDYDLVVCFDADQIIVDRLDEVIAGNYEVAGVRNNHDWGGSRNGPATMYTDSDVYTSLNCGLVASTNKQFWSDWFDLVTSGRDFLHGEEGAFNELAYSKYKTTLLDPVESKVYYGLSNTVGISYPWQSWLEIQVQENGLYLWGKKVKILHQCGGGESEHFTSNLFNKETLNYLEKITGTKFNEPT